MPRRLAVVVGGLAAALAFAGVAQARPFTLVASDVGVEVGSPGVVSVEERITVAFEGSYTFGFRDIPLRDGESIDAIQVREGGSTYATGAPAALEPGGPPGTFGIEQRGDTVRIVWRFQEVRRYFDTTKTTRSIFMLFLSYAYRFLSNFVFLALVYFALNFLEKYQHRVVVAVLVLVYAGMHAASALRSFHFFQRIERLELEARRLVAALGEGPNSTSTRKQVIAEVSGLRQAGEIKAYIDLLFLAIVILLCIAKIVAS